MNTDKIYAESIAKEYAPKDKSKIIALRKLDAKAKLPATIFTYTFGIISALVFGTGMCLSMQVIGDSMVLGIIIGIIGMLLERFHVPEKARAYVMKFYLTGVFAIVMEWLDKNCSDGMETVTWVITDCVMGERNVNG